MSFDAFQSAPTAAPSNPDPAPVSAPDPAPAPVSPDPMPAAASAPTPTAPVTPAGTPPGPYEPNFKFKVMDKEHEIPEWARTAIKDADTEKQAREIWEKAMGLDIVKPKYQAEREKSTQLQAQLQPFVQGVAELKEHYGRKDFDSLFKKLNIPENEVLQYFVNKAKYMELPPEQRQVLDAQKAAEQKAWALEKQNQTLSQQYEEAQTSAKAQALQITLDRADVKSLAQAFDTRAGTQGAFFQALCDQGELVWLQSGGKVDLTPEQAVQRVIAMYGNPMAGPQTPPMVPVAGSPAPQAHAPAPARKPATLPRIEGRQASSISKPGPKSLDDLKKMRIEKYGS